MSAKGVSTEKYEKLEVLAMEYVTLNNGVKMPLEGFVRNLSSPYDFFLKKKFSLYR